MMTLCLTVPFRYTSRSWELCFISVVMLRRRESERPVRLRQGHVTEGLTDSPVGHVKLGGPDLRHGQDHLIELVILSVPGQLPISPNLQFQQTDSSLSNALLPQSTSWQRNMEMFGIYLQCSWKQVLWNSLATTRNGKCFGRSNALIMTMFAIMLFIYL